MRRSRALLAAIALAITSTSAAGNTEGRAPPVGASYEVWVENTEDTSSSNGSSSFWVSRHKAAIVTVLSDSPDGRTLMYDNPLRSDGQRSTRFWRFPATIRYTNDSDAVLLDPAQHESRRSLTQEGMAQPERACVTHRASSAFLDYNCGTDAVLAHVRPYAPPPADLDVGSLIDHPFAKAPAPLIAQVSDNRTVYLVATLQIDPEKLRDALVDSSSGPKDIGSTDTRTKEDMRAWYANDVLEGTVTIHFDLSGFPDRWERTEVIQYTLQRGDDPVTTRIVQTRIIGEKIN